MLVNQDAMNFWQVRWLDQHLMGHNGFICGGCFKNIFNGEKVKDLDVFFRSADDWENAVEYFDKEDGYSFYYENKNVKAYKHDSTGVVIELCCKIYGSPQEILDCFDFTITKFAYYKEANYSDPFEDDDGSGEQKGDGTIESKVICDDKFFEHLHLKRLVIDNRIPYPMSTFERTLRYAKYGYHPCRETKMKIVEALREMPDGEQMSDNLYDGVD